MIGQIRDHSGIYPFPADRNSPIISAVNQSIKLPAKVGVLIVEDQTAIRQMLAAFVTTQPDFTVVGQSNSVHEAIELAERLQPRVVILDWMLTDGTADVFLKRAMKFKSPPAVLVFSGNTTTLAVRDALEYNAKGYIEKTATFDDFAAALRAVAEGKMYFGPAIAAVVQKLVRNPGGVEPGSSLTGREREVLRYVAEGLSSKDIAIRLDLSTRTVDNHRANIGRKTGLSSVAQLTRHALQLGLVTEGPSGPPP